MTISNENKDKLNKMNRASQNILLGDVLQGINSIVSSGSIVVSASSTGTPLVVNQYGSGSSAVFGNDDGKLTITNYGEIRFSGSATVWDDLRFPASSINPPGGIGGAGVDTVDSPFIGTLLFDSASTEICVGQAQMPHRWKEGSSISPHIHWSPTSTSTGSIVWQIDCDVANIGEPYSGSYTYSNQMVSYSDGILNDHKLLGGFPELEMPGKTLSTMVLWRVSRIGGSGSDTYVSDARLLEFDIHYQTDSLGSNEKYIKY